MRCAMYFKTLFSYLFVCLFFNVFEFKFPIVFSALSVQLYPAWMGLLESSVWFLNSFEVSHEIQDARVPRTLRGFASSTQPSPPWLPHLTTAPYPWYALRPSAPALVRPWQDQFPASLVTCWALLSQAYLKAHILVWIQPVDFLAMDMSTSWPGAGLVALAALCHAGKVGQALADYPTPDFHPTKSLQPMQCIDVRQYHCCSCTVFVLLVFN